MSTPMFMPRSAAVKMDTIVPFLEQAVRTNHIPFVHGPSGVGKSAVMRQVADKMGAYLIIVSLGGKEAVDFSGVPDVSSGRTIFNNPVTIPLKGDVIPWADPTGKSPEQLAAGDPDRLCIVFYDELPEGSEEVQKAIYLQLNEKEVNGTPIHHNVRQIAAGNTADHGANSKRMVAPLANRMFHISMELCHKAWLKHATYIGLPPIFRAWIASVPHYLHNYNLESEEDAFASPRSIVALAQYLDGIDLSDRSNPIGQAAPVMFLGAEAGINLLEFAQMADLPPLSQILADPASCNIPDMKGGTLHMLGQSLVSTVDGTNAPAVINAMTYLPADWRALTLNSMFGLPQAKQAELMKFKEYIQFASANKPMLAQIKSMKATT